MRSGTVPESVGLRLKFTQAWLTGIQLHHPAGLFQRRQRYKIVPRLANLARGWGKVGHGLF